MCRNVAQDVPGAGALAAFRIIEEDTRRAVLCGPGSPLVGIGVDGRDVALDFLAGPDVADVLDVRVGGARDEVESGLVVDIRSGTVRARTGDDQ
jgi:hypothetical protein